MTKYESKITATPCSAEQVYSVISDLTNLERVRDLIPQDKIQELEITKDYIRIKVDGLGQKINISIVEREPNKTVKYGTENSPVPVNFWIQLVEKNGQTYIRLTLGADIPFMFKPMLGKYEAKIQEGLDRGAEMFAQMPFQQWVADQN